MAITSTTKESPWFKNNINLYLLKFYSAKDRRIDSILDCNNTQADKSALVQSIPTQTRFMAASSIQVLFTSFLLLPNDCAQSLSMTTRALINKRRDDDNHDNLTTTSYPGSLLLGSVLARGNSLGISSPGGGLEHRLGNEVFSMKRTYRRLAIGVVQVTTNIVFCTSCSDHKLFKAKLQNKRKMSNL